MLIEAKYQSHHIPTIAAIGIVAWCIFAVLHEILGHAGAAILLGEQVQGAVTTTVHIADFYNLEHVTDRIGWWGFRTVAAAGTFVNFLAATLALLFLRSKSVTLPAMRYFLWFFATLSIFQQAFWLAVMPFASLGGDWAAFFIELRPAIPWKLGATLTGIILLWIGFKVPLRLWATTFGTGTQHSDLIWQLSSVPLVAAFTVQIFSVLWSPLSGSRYTTLVSLFSFIPLMIWLVIFNTTKHFQDNSSSETIRIERSYGWMAAGIIVAIIFIGVLGPGIGSFEGHPNYLK